MPQKRKFIQNCVTIFTALRLLGCPTITDISKIVMPYTYKEVYAY